ncbi:uncharacterized protein SAMN05444392_11120 [Seinonella peptonophila]|uniref:DUF418 domain-containing protein n=1 Tax=Seinonella peptonophila TaxID=112248 RepID=A0A1M4ZWW3_9BACL|nr:DUF418 domain-containing protein [Seinonella peptonophila]SHF22444.1 uncharacterized protein SAMN05444392_11120 [Seinonella peptonophila]
MNKTARIRSLDILRGFAILGTLLTNIWIFAYLGDLNYLFVGQQDIWSSGDSLLRVLSLALFNGKLLSLLAIMFGVGLELKYQQSLRKGRAWPGIYLWVSLILFIEGLLHFTLVMEYDILMSYAVTAVIVAYIVKRGERAIKWAMIIFGSIHLLLYLGVTVIQLSGASLSMGNMHEVVQLYQQGSWFEQVIFRLNNFILLRLELILAFSSNIFLFLTGVLLMRKGAFASDAQGIHIRRKLFRYGLLIGLPLNLLVFVPGGSFDLIVRYVFSAVLAIGYLGAFSLMAEKWQDWRIWNLLEQTGKMSLSCYVLQNLFCTVLFYGWGLGLGGKMGSVEVLLIWFGVAMLQIFFATTWLRFFQFGPIEAARRGILALITRQS